jgi:hypothetical protein
LLCAALIVLKLDLLGRHSGLSIVDELRRGNDPAVPQAGECLTECLVGPLKLSFSVGGG